MKVGGSGYNQAKRALINVDGGYEFEWNLAAKVNECSVA